MTPDPSAVAPASPVEDVDTRSAHRDAQDGIGLCLSGGGYRAMLFHVGVLTRSGGPTSWRATSAGEGSRIVLPADAQAPRLGNQDGKILLVKRGGSVAHAIEYEKHHDHHYNRPRQGWPR